MAWELVAIWLITGLTILLFRRSEAQRRDQALAQRARAFAVDPVYRHKPSGLTADDRAYFRSLVRRSPVQR
jgi:hypothetical protein